MSDKLEELWKRIFSGGMLLISLIVCKKNIHILVFGFTLIAILELIYSIKISKNKEFQKFLIVFISFAYLIISLFSLFKITRLFIFMVCVFVVDTSSFIIGSVLKGRVSLKGISPNKTIAGYLGGLIFGTIAFYHEIYCIEYSSFLFSVCASIFTAIGAQLGDLAASYIKRKLKIKDFSNLIPGHGGFLDRFDSLYLSSIFYCILSMWK